MIKRIKSAIFDIGDYRIRLFPKDTNGGLCFVCNILAIRCFIVDNSKQYCEKFICCKCTEKYNINHPDLHERKKGIALLKIKELL